MSENKDTQLIWENYVNKRGSNDIVEEEMYDCVRDYMSDGYSRAEAEKMQLPAYSRDIHWTLDSLGTMTHNVSAVCGV